jgi:exonuclease SbcC
MAAAHASRALLGENLSGWREQLQQGQQLQRQTVQTEGQMTQLQKLARQLQQQADAQTQQSTQSTRQVSQTLQQQQAAEQALQQQLTTHGSLPQLRSHWQNAERQLHHWQQLQEHAALRQPLDVQQQRNSQALSSVDSRIQEQLAQRDDLRAQYKALKEKVADKQALLDQERLIQSLQEHRAALQPGDACPLCGSQDHPAITEYAALDVSATAAALQQAQSELESLQRQGEQLNTALATAQGQRQQQQEQHQAIAQQIEKWLSRWADLRAQSAVPLDEAAWQQPEALRTACAEAGQQIAQLQQNLADAETAERQLQQSKDACQAAVQHQQQIEHAQASTRQALQNNLTQQEQTAQALQALMQQAGDLQTRLQLALQTAGYALPDSADTADWLDARQQEWQQWQRQQQAMQELTQQIDLLQRQVEQAAEDAEHWLQRSQALPDCPPTPPPVQCQPPPRCRTAEFCSSKQRSNWPGCKVRQARHKPRSSSCSNRRSRPCRMAAGAAGQPVLRRSAVHRSPAVRCRTARSAGTEQPASGRGTTRSHLAGRRQPAPDRTASTGAQR